MQTVFPKKSAILSTCVTLLLVTGLFWGFREAIELLQRVQKVDIPLLELTSINLRLQDNIQNQLEILVATKDQQLISTYLENRALLEDQLTEYDHFLNSELKDLGDRKKLGPRTQLNLLENRLIELVKASKNIEAASLLQSTFYKTENESFKKTFQDIAEKLAENRDIGIAFHLKQMLILFLCGIFTLIVIIVMWWKVFRAYKSNLVQRENAENELNNERVKAVHAAKMVTLGEMAGGIAHEINNPLSILLASLDIIKSRVGAAELNRTSIVVTIEKMDRTIERISRIVRGLKSFSRDGERDPFVKNNMSLIIEETLELVQGKCKKFGVNLITHPEQYEFDFECRSVQISQVILNLISNSVDAIKDLEDRWIDISMDQGSKNVCVKVTDSGNGISKESAEKIFNPFYTTKKVGEGTGLGLSISFSIVKAHQGRLYINFESKFTQFIIDLPKVQSVSEGVKRGVS